jgi:hypothetical protein
MHGIALRTADTGHAWHTLILSRFRLTAKKENKKIFCYEQ